MTWREVADAAKGWLADEEAELLCVHAARVARLGPLLEIGGYAGKSACWLGQVAKDHGSLLFSVDWHRGSPEMAPDRECHDPNMVGPDGFDTLPHFRRNIRAAELDNYVVPVVGRSEQIGRFWQTPISFLFIDGAHDPVGVHQDFTLWAPHVISGGVIAFHDTEIAAISEVAVIAEAEGFQLLAELDNLRVLGR